MSKKVSDRFRMRWNRDYPDGGRPQLQEDPFASEKMTDEQIKQREGTKKSQEDYLEEKKREADRIDEGPTNGQPVNEPSNNGEFGDKTADAFHASDSFDFMF